MRSLLRLCGVELQQLLHALHLGQNKRARTFAAPLAAVIMAVLMAYIGVATSWPMGMLLLPSGAEHLYWCINLLMSFSLCVCVTVSSAGGLLFSGRDLDFLFALPLPAHTVLLAKLLAVYLQNLLGCLFLLLPSEVVCALYGNFSLLRVLALAVVVLVFPLVATALSALVGFFVSAVAGRLRHKSLAIVLGTVAAMLAIFAAIGGLQSLLLTPLQDPAAAQSWRAPGPLGWACDALSGRGLPGLLGFSALCAGVFALFTLALARVYQPLVLRLAGRGLRTGFSLARQSASGALRALYKKEAARFFGTPIYLFNTSFGPLLLGVLGFALLFFPAPTAELLALSAPGVSPVLVLSIIVAFSLLLTSPSAVSLSLECKSIWLLQSAPMGALAVLRAKFLFAATIGLPCLLPVLPGAWAAFRLPPAQLAALALFGVCCSVFAAALGLAVNLRLPRLDGINDTVIVKQSASVLVAMLITLAPSALLVGLGLLCSSPTVFLLLGSALLAALSGLVYLFIARRGPALFAALSAG